jgi:exonuclease VII large subunit
MIDLLFQLLNVAILLAIGIYIFKKTLAPSFKSKLDQEHLVIQNLHEEHAQLILSQTALEESIILQQQECSALKEKIDQWRNATYDRLQEQQQESERMLSLLQQKLVLQERNYSLRQLQKQVAPVVIETLEKEFESYFAQPENRDNYLYSAVMQLKRVQK